MLPITQSISRVRSLSRRDIFKASDLLCSMTVLDITLDLDHHNSSVSQMKLQA